MKTKERKVLRAPQIKDGCTDDGRRAVTPDEAQLLLGLGRSSTYVAIHNGEIPSFRIGGKILIPVAAIEKLLTDAGGQASHEPNPAA